MNLKAHVKDLALKEAMKLAALRCLFSMSPEGCKILYEAQV